MEIKTKKIILTGLLFALASLFFLISVSSASAACSGSKNQNQASILSVFKPILPFAEKVIKSLGYNVALATAPDPDFCGSDTVVCSGGVPQATISWEPIYFAYQDPIWGEIEYWDYYVLTVSGLGDFNTGSSNSYNVTSGLANNTTYNWSVEVWCIPDNPPFDECSVIHNSADYWYTDQPHGSFTTPTCAACVPDCSCAATTCIGSTCSDGCGGTCAGTKAPNCSCAATTCIGSTCSDGCGGTCAGTLNCACIPDCSCAANTCTGTTCSDGCAGTCSGTKNCQGGSYYQEVAPKEN